MTKKKNWRLGKLPTPDEIRGLVLDKIITNDEARDMLFSDKEDSDVKNLESEIKFLRELVEKLSNGRQNTIVETIRYIERPYNKYPWYGYYASWCSGSTALAGLGSTNVSASNALLGGTSGNLPQNSSSGTSSFSSISTF